MFRRLLREYLSLTKGERRGFQVLASLVMTMILLRLMMPDLLRPTEQTALSIQSLPSGDPSPTSQVMLSHDLNPPDDLNPSDNTASSHAISASDPLAVPRKGREYFYFDPNVATQDSLILLGIKPGIARILIRYREHGGRFQKKEDLRKIYGLEEKDYLLLEPWIRIVDMADHLPAGINLNLADTSQLMRVPGIGPVFSRRIIRFRELLGGFYSLDQLHEVYGLSEEQFNSLSLACFTDSSRIRRMDMNTSEREVLERHPYLDRYQVSALLSYRESMGGFRHLDEIPQNRLLPPGVYSKISPYLMVNY